jgi:hypothetical protein
MCCSLIECAGSSMLMRKKARAKKKRPAFGQSLATGMWLTFRAELMPGRDPLERTFEVTRVLENRRVELATLEGQHSLAEFEPILKSGKGS